MKFKTWKKLNDLEALRDWTWSQINEMATQDDDLIRRKNFIISNAKYKKELKFIELIINEYKQIYSKLGNEIKNTLEYSKGNYRIRINGTFKYLKSNVKF